MNERDDKEMEQFIRIAMAQIRSKYKFLPQRRAVAAKMYTRWKNSPQNWREYKL